MPLNRRTFLGRSAATGAGAALAGGAVAGPARAAGTEGQGHGRPAKRYAFTVMGTTDLHGSVFNGIQPGILALQGSGGMASPDCSDARVATGVFAARTRCA